MIEEFLLDLLPTINGLVSEVYIPVECILFQRIDKLFYQKVTSIAISFNKVGDMFPWVPLAIKLLKLWWLIVCSHWQTINQSGMWLGVTQGTLWCPPYWAIIVFVIISCNCWTDSATTKVYCFSFWNFDFPRGYSTYLFCWSKPYGQVGMWLNSLGVKASNLFISWAMWWFLSSTYFFKALMVGSIIANFSFMLVESAINEIHWSWIIH